MKIIANKSLCSGQARCVAAAPEIFQLDENSYIGFSEKEILPEQMAAAKRGVRACPERALKIQLDETA